MRLACRFVVHEFSICLFKSTGRQTLIEYLSGYIWIRITKHTMCNYVNVMQWYVWYGLLAEKDQMFKVVWNGQTSGAFWKHHKNFLNVQLYVKCKMWLRCHKKRLIWHLLTLQSCSLTVLPFRFFHFTLTVYISMLCTFSPGQQTSNKTSISTKIEPTVTSLHMCRFTMKPVNVFRVVLFSVSLISSRRCLYVSIFK